MTDENRSLNPEAEDDDATLQAPVEEPEPEGDPLARERAFLQERLSRLRPREEREEEDTEDLGPPETLFPEAPTPAPSPKGTPGQPPSEIRRLGRRRELIVQYRGVQREHLERQQDLPAVEDEDLNGDEAYPGNTPNNHGEQPPEPPLPPPANNWIPIGPSALRRGQAATQPTTSGRTVGIAVAAGGDRVYIGTANGGVWRSEDAGESWHSLMEALDLNPTQQAADSLACGAIALVPGTTPNTDLLYVGTGEGPGGAYFGVGPIVSNDGGANWLPPEPVSSGSPDLAGTAFYALAVDPTDATRVVAGTRRGLYRREPDGSGGFHWDQKALPGASSSSWTTSVVACESGGSTTFYAAPWFGPVYKSTDGDAWTQVGTNFPTTNVGRIGLAVQPDNPDTVYALIHNNSNRAILGVWRLNSSDNVWRQITGHPPNLFGNPVTGNPPTQGSYDLAIAVDPNNINRIYLGGSTVLSGGAWSGSLYRCVVSSSGSGTSLTYSMTPTYIGASVHADIHTLVFAPGDSNKLWVGCDGGVYYSTNPTATGNVFSARNSGLATLTMNHLAQHPTEDAVVFGGTQDNGGARFTGEEAWLHSVWGDSGHFVVNWDDPYKILSTYVRASVNRSIDGGSRYNYSSVDVPIAAGEPVLFYAPLVGTPTNPGNPSEASIVAFGSIRPWISTGFGGGWQSIPNGTLSDDGLVGQIRSLAFASADRLYAGTNVGEVYRFDNTASSWTSTRIDTDGGVNALALAGTITDIAVVPTDDSSIYITFGGSGDYRHVWYYDGALQQWEARSGPSAVPTNQLLDVQHNAIVVDPDHPNHLYAGADIGVWRSTDAGTNWQYFSDGLPDAAVIDLRLHQPRRLLRVSTHGRGVYERRLDTATADGVELYVRDTQLDQGRLATVNGRDDPTDKGEDVWHWRGPDIKLDTPDAAGNYQFPLTGSIDFVDFVDVLSDDFRNVATHTTANIVTRAYVQVHNRGVIPANNVRVMLLLANASAALPALPANYWTNLQNGTPITTPDWKTVGIETIDDVRVGFPKIASFDLNSNMLPPPGGLAGNDHHCVLALVHHLSDPYTTTETNTDLNSRQERKAAHKNLKVVQFTGTLPLPPIVIPVRIHNPSVRSRLLTRLAIQLNGYQGRIHLVIPPVEMEGPIEELVDGMELIDESEDFIEWADKHVEMIHANLESRHPFNRDWSKQRIEDIALVTETGAVLQATNDERISLRHLIMEPEGRHTVFLILDRPEDGRPGDTFDIAIQQFEERPGEERENLIGTLDTRVEVVPEPEIEKYFLRLWTRPWRGTQYLVRARLYDSEDNRVTVQDDARVILTLRSAFGQSEDLGPMKWHRGWSSFYYILRPSLYPSWVRLAATAWVHDQQVAEATISRDLRPMIKLADLSM